MTFENLRVDKIKTVVRYRDSSTDWQAKNRRDHIIGVCISGITYHDLGYKQINLAPDYIYFFNQRDDYAAHVAEFGECYSVHFTAAEPIETDSFCKKVNNTEELIRMIKQIERAWLQREQGELLMLAEFYGFCHALQQLYRAPYAPRDARIAESKTYMDVHFSKGDCLARAVEMSGVSARRFNDIFKKNYAQTPNAYIVRKRVNYAAELLTTTYLSIGDIAELSGFSDVYYFSKCFKHCTGSTPGRYRRGIGSPISP